MLNVFECHQIGVVWRLCPFVGQQRRILCVCARGSRRECWTTKMTKISVAILSTSHRFKQIFVEASHHQEVLPLCDEPWTPLAGLRGLSFSIENGVDLRACSKEVLISACSTWSITLIFVINDGIMAYCQSDKFRKDQWWFACQNPFVMFVLN